MADSKEFLDNIKLEKVHNKDSEIKKVIGVVSGKGGVGKSLVTSMLSCIANRKGLKTAIMDADITGPSIPKAFGVHTRAVGTQDSILPVETKSGIKMISMNVLMDEETQPVLWRGPVIAGAVGQFWNDVIWGDIDVMFVDMPPGTGDVALTVFQQLPVDGIIVVSSPQELVEMIVAKAVRMADLMKVPVLGLVENMSYFECPDCGKKHEIFGKSRLSEVSAKYGITNLAQLPIAPEVTKLVDSGKIEEVNVNWLDDLFDNVIKD